MVFQRPQDAQPSPKGTILGAVSYTHLDVYKRQEKKASLRKQLKEAAPPKNTPKKKAKQQPER